MNPLIDTHLHLDLLSDPVQQSEEARALGVETFVIPGVRPDRWNLQSQLAVSIPGAWFAPGIHPMAAAAWQDSDADQLRQQLRHPRAIAVGEVGLDRLVDSPMQVQEYVFRQMIRLAIEMNKPLLIHCRKATERLIQVLTEEGANRVGGIMHAFSGSKETAQKIIELGFCLGIGGIITFPNTQRLPDVVRRVPAENLVLETDAPDMTPHPYRGQPNKPAYLTLMAEAVAELRGWSTAEGARITTENARRVLHIP